MKMSIDSVEMSGIRLVWLLAPYMLRVLCYDMQLLMAFAPLGTKSIHQALR